MTRSTLNPELSTHTSRELEIELLRRKIAAQETALHRALQTVADIHRAQLGRLRELGLQEEQLRRSTLNSQPPTEL